MKTSKEIVKFDIETAIITALDTEYKEVQKITDAESKAIVAEGRRKYRELRLAVVDGHKGEKREALDYCNFLDAEKRRILGLLAPGESHLDGIWQAHRDEIDRKERERIKAIQEKINNIRDLGIMLPSVSSPVIEERLIIIKGQMLTQEVYQEFTIQAEDAHNSAIATLEEALKNRLQFEREDVARKIEMERLEAQRKKQEVAQAKIDEANKAAAKRQAENDARMAAEQAKIDEEKREIEESRKKFEENERKAKLKKEQEEFERQATIKAEEDAKRSARESFDRIERERIAREEAEAKEKARQAAMAPDKKKLRDWINGFNETVFPSPQLKGKKAQEILRIAKEQIEMILQDALDKIRKL